VEDRCSSRFWNLGRFALGISLGAANIAFAAPTANGPQLKVRHPLKEAVQLEITPSGENFMGSRFSDILSQLGVSATSAYFPDYQHDIDLRPAPSTGAAEFRIEDKPLYRDILDTLEEWLVGLKLDDPQLHLALKDLSLEADLVRSELRSRPDFLVALRNKVGPNALGLELALEFSSLSASSSNLSINDRRNDFLGTFTILDPRLGLDFKKSPLVIKVPMVFFLDKTTGDARLELLKLAVTMDEPEVSLTHKGLVIPPMEVSINGRSFPLKTERLERLLDENKDEWIDKALGTFEAYANGDLAKSLQTKVDSSLPKEIVQLDVMSPPALPKGSRDPFFVAGMKLSRLLQPDNMRLHFDYFVEDTLRPNLALRGVRPTSGLIEFNDIPLSQFDIGLGLDLSIINRILDLTYLRGYIANFKDDNGATLLRLNKTPKVRSRDTVRSKRLAVDMEILQDLQGMQTWLMNSPLRVNITVYAELRTNPKGQLEVVVNSLDTNSFWVDEAQFTFLGKMFKGKITSEIRKKLEASNAELGKKPVIFADLPLPPEIFGMKFKAVTQTVDPSGALILYLRRP
jgi:hypothetical protein